MVEPHKIKEVSQAYADRNNKFRMFLKNQANSDDLDRQFCDLHNEIFYKYEYDCCKCNNCCKFYDVRVEQKDIPAISEYLGLDESIFIERYLLADKEEADCFVMKEKPCYFLQSDGKCGIYECRPLVCKEFPHTKKPDRLFSLTGLLGFAEDCPVVFEIIERLKKMYCFKEQLYKNRRVDMNE